MCYVNDREVTIFIRSSNVAINILPSTRHSFEKLSYRTISSKIGFANEGRNLFVSKYIISNYFLIQVDFAPDT